MTAQLGNAALSSIKCVVDPCKRYYAGGPLLAVRSFFFFLFFGSGLGPQSRLSDSTITLTTWEMTEGQIKLENDHIRQHLLEPHFYVHEKPFLPQL